MKRTALSYGALSSLEHIILAAAFAFICVGLFALIMGVQS